MCARLVCKHWAEELLSVHARVLAPYTVQRLAWRVPDLESIELQDDDVFDALLEATTDKQLTRLTKLKVEVLSTKRVSVGCRPTLPDHKPGTLACL